jgi:hypothetical protein
VQRVRAQRSARVTARRAQRDERTAEIDDQRDRDHGELVPVDSRRPGSTGEVTDRFDRDDHAAGDQDRRLAERAEVLRAAVAVRVLRVGRTPAEAHREERQHGGDHVAARLDARRDQPEASGRQPDAQLQSYEGGRGCDRDERRAPWRERLIRLRAGRHRQRLIAALPATNACKSRSTPALDPRAGADVS